MLNFSGEKGKHFGTRGQGHRAIGVIYANSEGGSRAMLDFMRDGNIRIMGETPGIDVSVGTKITREQFDTPDDAELIGSYLFYQSEQSGDAKYWDAVCNLIEGGKAVIGVSHELMNCGSKEFCEIVYLMRNRRTDGTGPYRPIRKARKW